MPHIALVHLLWTDARSFKWEKLTAQVSHPARTILTKHMSLTWVFWLKNFFRNSLIANIASETTFNFCVVIKIAGDHSIYKIEGSRLRHKRPRACILGMQFARDFESESFPSFPQPRSTKWILSPNRRKWRWTCFVSHIRSIPLSVHAHCEVQSLRWMTFVQTLTTIVMLHRALFKSRLFQELSITEQDRR